MRPTTRFARGKDECLALAKAFEGMSGALHEGRPVERADVNSALRAARLLWKPDSGRHALERTFNNSCQAIVEALPAVGRGDANACVTLEVAAQRIGHCLRAKVRGRPARASRVRTVVPSITKLDEGYARYAGHPTGGLPEMEWGGRAALEAIGRS